MAKSLCMLNVWAALTVVDKLSILLEMLMKNSIFRKMKTRSSDLHVLFVEMINGNLAVIYV